MSRPAKQPYDPGKTSPTGVTMKDGTPQWRATYIDRDHVRRYVTVTAKSQSAAERSIKAKVREASTVHRGGSADLNERTPLAQVADLWLAEVESRGRSAKTMTDYRGYVQRSIKTGSLSRLTVSQANDRHRIKSWLQDIADTRGNTAAKQSRKVLSGILCAGMERGSDPRVRHAPRRFDSHSAQRYCRGIEAVPGRGLRWHR